jgi:hypothetical protein
MGLPRVKVDRCDRVPLERTAALATSQWGSEVNYLLEYVALPQECL